MIEINHVYHMDAIELLNKLDDDCVDMLLCDLPNGITQNKWDKKIPLKELWEGYRRVVKQDGAMVLMGNQPYTSEMVFHNKDIFRYSLVWVKNKASNFLMAKKRFMRIHEDILVFCRRQPMYNPQYTHSDPYIRGYRTQKSADRTTTYGRYNPVYQSSNGKRYPKSVLYFPIVQNPSHSAQHPIELGEYLIKTFTNEGDLVLDNACGSGSFLVAAQRTGRSFIGCDIDIKSFELSKKRLEEDLNEDIVI